MTADGSVSTSALRFSVLERIDAICDQFEVDRQAGHSTDLAEYLVRLETSTGTQARQELLCQLVVLDLEYGWQCDFVETLTATSRPSMVEDYRTAFPELTDLPAQRFLELIGAEYRARHLWGDGPRRREYLDRFAEHSAVLNSRLRAVMAHLLPTRVTIYHRGDRVYSTILSAPLEIGRQRPGEPEPYCCLDGEDRDRLVIAPVGEKRVSRCHLHVEAGSTEKVRGVNRSSKNAIIVNSHGHIGPGETCLVERPSLLSVVDRVVKLDAY